MAAIFIPQRPAWETVKDAKAAYACVRIEYAGMAIGFACLAGFIFLTAVARFAKADSLNACYLLAVSLVFLGLSGAVAARRRRIIREGRYTAGDIYAIIAPQIASAVLWLAIVAVICAKQPHAIVFLGPCSVFFSIFAFRELSGWRQCLSYLG